MIDRRRFLQLSAGAAAHAWLQGCGPKPEPWSREAYRRTDRSRVAVLPAVRYDDSLRDTLRKGLELFPLDVRGRTVVLKPNLVEFDPRGVINTHPAVVAAAIEAFRDLGAREVVVAEGPGHRRDSEYILRAAGFLDLLDDLDVRYVDLNTDAVRKVALRSSFTGLGLLYLPETVLDAGLFVSMPKLKTHHWAGVTLSMKNLFGIVPSVHYGWPKNVLHWAGIEGSILDINAALDVPRFNIVDGIVGMEGNGPIQGDPLEVGALVLGADPVAVDATCARMMNLEPAEVGYLRQAGAFLGNLTEEAIEQVGVDPADLARDFRVLDAFERLKPRPLPRIG